MQSKHKVVFLKFETRFHTIQLWMQECKGGGGKISNAYLAFFFFFSVKTFQS